MIMFIHSQLLATKFFVPVASGTLISRPRLTTSLQESLTHPLTLISAPAGFGKTTLLSTWVRSLPPSQPLAAWVSLDEEDNDPRLFWTYVLNALEMQDSEGFSPLLKYLQSPQLPPLKYILTGLINQLASSTQHFLLILDDYHVINEQEVHTTLAYLVEHLPPQLHIILVTRADPPLLLPQLRARQQVLEVRAEQLRCTVEETKAFFKEVIGIEHPDETIQKVTARTEGWLAGLHLLALSLRKRTDPLTLLEETSGDQRYILDFLIQEVLQRQSQEVQTFLLSTCILERLSASLCNAVMQRSDSQQMLERLEQSNLFVTSLDSKRQWYRYHALFAEALCSQLEQTQSDLALALHHRASRWYAEHDQTTEAILHAFHAHQLQWAADLIERIPLLTLGWRGASQHKLVLLRQWLEQLPADILHSRPRLCLAGAQILWQVTSPTMLEVWLSEAEATLTAQVAEQERHEDMSYITLPAEAWQKLKNPLQEQENLLSEVIATRAFLRSFQDDGQATLPVCQQVLTMVSPENFAVRALVALTQSITHYVFFVKGAETAIEWGLQAVAWGREVGQKNAFFVLGVMGVTAVRMIGAGRLHDAHRLTQQAMQLGTETAGLMQPEVGWPAVFQADILREWNKLDEALSLVKEAILQCELIASTLSLTFLLHGYAVLLRIYLSRGELEAACSALQQFERIGRDMNQPYYSYVHSLFTTVDQIRLWLARDELDDATRWAKELDLGRWCGTPFAREREEVACARILLAMAQPAVALQRLEPVLVQATACQRWDHVIEVRLLQALACQMQHYEEQALSALSVAVHLAEPQGYIRRFVDEGAPMAALLSRLREQQCEQGPTPYLDTLLAVFPKQSKGHKRQTKQSRHEVKPC